MYFQAYVAKFEENKAEPDCLLSSVKIHSSLKNYL